MTTYRRKTMNEEEKTQALRDSVEKWRQMERETYEEGLVPGGGAANCPCCHLAMKLQGISDFERDFDCFDWDGNPLCAIAEYIEKHSCIGTPYYSSPISSIGPRNSDSHKDWCDYTRRMRSWLEELLQYRTGVVDEGPSIWRELDEE
jgi:hypothetical protein